MYLSYKKSKSNTPREFINLFQLKLYQKLVLIPNYTYNSRLSQLFHKKRPFSNHIWLSLHQTQYINLYTTFAIQQGPQFIKEKLFERAVECWKEQEK